MAAKLSRMERDGIVLRWSNPADERTLLYALSSPMGEKAMAIREVVNEVNQLVGGSLIAEDLNSFHRILRTMAQSQEKVLDE